MVGGLHGGLPLPSLIVVGFVGACFAITLIRVVFMAVVYPLFILRSIFRLIHPNRPLQKEGMILHQL
jgi:hypothetical protein